MTIATSNMKDCVQVDRPSDYSAKRVSEADRKELKDLIKACIISRKDGLSPNDLPDEYTKCTGEPCIPFARVGYCSLFHLIHDMSDVKLIKNELGDYVLVVTRPGKSGHIQRMVERQKNPKDYKPRYDKETKRRDRHDREKKRRQSTYDRQREDKTGSFSNDEDYYQDERFPPVDENWDRPYIYLNPDIHKKKICTEPVIGTSQLIGDDFFLQLCIKYLSLRLERLHEKSGIVCGSVESGLTIREAYRRLSKMEMMSNKLVINLGTVDIYNRRTCEQMIEDYEQLLKLLSSYGYSPKRITVCTLPPLANVGVYSEVGKYSNMLAFNNYLREISARCGYKLLDFFKEFITDEEMPTIQFEYFQSDARMVSGTSHPHVLWNYHGRQKAMKLLMNV